MMENREMAICKVGNATASMGIQIVPQIPRIDRPKKMSVMAARSVGF